jgi:predicted porin
MIKSRLAMLALCGTMLTTPAWSQSSVTIYGIIDAGFVTATNVGTVPGTATMITPGVMQTSRIGFRGVEDLGGGAKSGFVLETQLVPTDGSNGYGSGSGAGNQMFSRAAYLFLEKQEYGRMQLGRQLNLAYTTFNQMDTRGGINFGSSLDYWADGSSFGGTPTAKTGLSSLNGGNFLSNALRYDTPKIGGFRLGGQYITGGSSMGESYSRLWNLVATYEATKNLNLVTGIFNGNNTSGVAVAQTWFAGGNYTYNRWKFATGYTSFENPNGNGAANTKFDLKQVSTRYTPNNKWSVSGGYYNLSDRINSNNGSQTMSLVGDYYLSKRTSLYAGVARSNNQGTSGFAAYGGGGANANSLATKQYPSVLSSGGLSQTAYTVGMMHTF